MLLLSQYSIKLSLSLVIHLLIATLKAVVPTIVVVFRLRWSFIKLILHLHSKLLLLCLVFHHELLPLGIGAVGVGLLDGRVVAVHV